MTPVARLTDVTTITPSRTDSSAGNNDLKPIRQHSVKAYENEVAYENGLFL